MREIATAIIELQQTIFSTAVMMAFLDSLVVFMISFLACLLIKISWLFAFIPFFIYLVLHMRSAVKRANLSLVEEKVPELREILRTSADHIHTESHIVSELHKDVLERMHHIKVSYFINFKQLWKRLGILSILCFIILFVAAQNVRFLDLPDTISDFSSNQQEKLEELGIEEIYEDETGSSGSSDIYGDYSVAELGTQELDLQINPIMSEIDINDVSEVEERDFREGEFPTSIEATNDRSFESDEQKDSDKEIVKNYFKDINTNT